MSQGHQIPAIFRLKAKRAGKNLINFSALIVITIALLSPPGCSSTKKSGQVARPKGKQETGRSTEGQNPAGATVQNEDFDPMTLQGPEFRIERKQVVRKSDTLTITTAATPVDTSWQTVPGYRVQLLQTEDAKLARATVRDAILALNTEVEIIYEAPYYKVRAGQFTNRYDAEQLQNLASEKGYANCWVVRTQVKVRANELLNQK